MSTFQKVNERELDFLKEGKNTFQNGIQFQPKNHPYSFDLDIIGEGSLYQHLNRTQLYYGQQFLADRLLHPKKQHADILQRQEAIEELSKLTEWRQLFQVLAEIGKDSKQIVAFIVQWKEQETNISPLHQLLKWVLPIVGAGSMLLLLITQHNWWFSLGITLFIIQLIVFASCSKKILAALGQLDNIEKTISSYAILMQQIENQHWESPYLKSLKSRLQHHSKSASQHMIALSSIYQRLASVQNGFAMLVLNGTLLYHIHAFSRFVKWKKDHATEIEKWMIVLGEMEELISFANFKFNNPGYTFPSLNTDYNLSFNDLGHPMIDPSKRVNNSIDFSQQPYVILTGSNMSGKSTFLRSVGIGLILGNSGSVIPATSSNIHPLQLFVSMRLSDSLLDSESYFFAEVKRLQHITKILQQERCFVLLDELLRGTNSDDKRDGTIAVLKKMVHQQAIGILATHDLEVCETQIEYPNYISNQCFEVNMVENELQFDYQLRNGICKNKSATFIMQKLEII